VPESGDDGRDESQAILALVRDQNSQMIGLAVTHLTPSVESSAQPARSTLVPNGVRVDWPCPNL
jgi:hypothetical protein